MPMRCAWSPASLPAKDKMLAGRALKPISGLTGRAGKLGSLFVPVGSGREPARGVDGRVRWRLWLTKEEVVAEISGFLCCSALSALGVRCLGRGRQPGPGLGSGAAGGRQVATLHFIF